MIEAGTKIICPDPGCAAEIAEITKSIQIGDRIQIGSLKSLGGLIEDGAAMACHVCKKPYFYNGKIHTERGWRP